MRFRILLLSVLGLSLRLAAQTPALPNLRGSAIVVAVEDDYPPFNYVPPGRAAAVGWDYEVVGELAKRLHFQPDFREIAWDSMVQGVASGQFDMAGNGITVTLERSRVVEFSAPYMQVHQRLLVRKDEARFSTLEQFAKTSGARLGAQKGNTNYTKAAGLIGEDRIVAYDGFGELIQALLSGDLDAVIIDDVGGQGYVGANAEKLKLLSGQLDGQDLAFIFPKGSPLRGPVNAALAAMKADGTLERIDARWFSPSFRADHPPAP